MARHSLGRLWSNRLRFTQDDELVLFRWVPLGPRGRHGNLMGARHAFLRTSIDRVAIHRKIDHGVQGENRSKPDEVHGQLKRYLRMPGGFLKIQAELRDLP